MKHFRLIILCFLLCILSAFLTLCVINANLTNNQTPVTKKEFTNDLYSASLTLCQIFERCGHTIADSSLGTVSYSSPEELLHRFPGYQITSGEGEKVVLSAAINDFCPWHYKAVLSNEIITITKLSDGEKITSFEIIKNSLSENEKKLLEQGITLDSDKALTSFIEDFTS